MLDLLQETPVAEFSRAFPQEGVTYTPSETDAIMAHRFTEVSKGELVCRSIANAYLIVKSRWGGS